MSKAKPNCKFNCTAEGLCFVIREGKGYWVLCPDRECSGPREAELEEAGQRSMFA